MITTIIHRIPKRMIGQNNWVIWARYEDRPGHMGKCPIDHLTMRGAEADNRNTWTDFDTAAAALDRLKGQHYKVYRNETVNGKKIAKEYDGEIYGIGFEFGDYNPKNGTGSKSGLVFIDLDNIADDLQAYRDGQQRGIVWEFIHAFDAAGIKICAEVSQSGNGIHIFCIGTLPEKGRRKGNIEMYDTGRFCAMTGNFIDDDHTDFDGDGTAVLSCLHSKYIAPAKQAAKPRTAPNPAAVHDVDIDRAIDTANKVDKKFSALWAGDITGYPSQSEADQALCNKLAYYLHGDRTKMDTAFRASGLYRDKWDRKTGDTTYGAMTIAKAVEMTTTFFDYNQGKGKKMKKTETGGGTAKNLFDWDSVIGEEQTASTSEIGQPSAAPTDEPAEPPPDEVPEAVSSDDQTDAAAEKSTIPDDLDGYVLTWKEKTGLLTATGVKRCTANVKRYVQQRNLLYDVRFNDFSDYAEIDQGFGDWQRITDRDLLIIIDRIHARAAKERGIKFLSSIQGWDITKTTIQDIILTDAVRVNPVKNYFESLQWDGIHRIDTLLYDVFGADENQYTASAMWLFLLGVITRVYNPGAKFDYMLVLQGEQGFKKTAFFKALAVKPEWYGSIGAAHMQDRKLLGEDAAGKLILEYEEMDGISKTTAEKLKATITRTEDQYRPAYSILSEMHPRKYVIGGTTNKTQYLSDPSGHRRYLPIPIKKKGDFSTELINQVWAEAYARYKANGIEMLYLSNETNEIADQYRNLSTRLISDEFIDEIENFLNTCPTPDGEPPQHTTVKTIYEYFKDKTLGQMKYSEAEKIILTALSVLKWEYKSVKVNGKPVKRYVRPKR